MGNKMNCVEVQTELLRAQGKGEARMAGYLERDGNVYLSVDGYRFFVIPKSEVFINLKNLPRFPAKLKTFLHPEEAEEAFFDGETRRLKDGRTVRKIQTGGYHVWLDEGLLADYGRITSYRVVPRDAPVYIYDGAALIGVCLPVIVDE